MEHTNRQFKMENPGPERLDHVVVAFCNITRSQVQKLIKYGVLSVNGKKVTKSGLMLREGDLVDLNFDNFAAESKVELTEEEKALLADIKIVAETDDYIIIDKPSGLVTHPSAQATSEEDVAQTVSVAGWVLAHYPKLWGIGEYANRPGIVHRLDKETSGLMVIAKHQKMFDHLKKQFQDRLTKKKYIALVHGAIDHDNGVLDFEITLGKDGKMVSLPKVKEVSLQTVRNLQTGKPAITEYEVVRRFVRYTLVHARPKTGRTHQIRVHFFAYNHPLVGDPLYFNKKNEHARDRKLGRLFLHSAELSFLNLNSEEKQFESPLPQKLEDFMKNIT